MAAPSFAASGRAGATHVSGADTQLAPNLDGHVAVSAVAVLCRA